MGLLGVSLMLVSSRLMLVATATENGATKGKTDTGVAPYIKFLGM